MLAEMLKAVYYALSIIKMVVPVAEKLFMKIKKSVNRKKDNKKATDDFGE